MKKIVLEKIEDEEYLVILSPLQIHLPSSLLIISSSRVKDLVSIELVIIPILVFVSTRLEFGFGVSNLSIRFVG